jgi:antitoxin MazE
MRPARGGCLLAAASTLDSIPGSDYCNYMRTTLIRIGNSRGLRLPRKLLATYGISENDELELEERAEGILIRPAPRANGKLPWEAAYREMAADAGEVPEWSAWEAAVGDGLER